MNSYDVTNNIRKHLQHYFHVSIRFTVTMKFRVFQFWFLHGHLSEKVTLH